MGTGFWDFPSLWYGHLHVFEMLQVNANVAATAARWVDPAFGFALGWVSGMHHDPTFVTKLNCRIISMEMRMSTALVPSN